jgi:hypothetical protein
MAISDSKITMLSVERNVHGQRMLLESFALYAFDVDLIAVSTLDEVKSEMQGKIRPDVVFADFHLVDGSVTESFP